ncbi:cytochrome P450 89A2-like [Nicotiana sylvestris]|uniref:cytochrome P450 89A2-like n=1 Tax=Nicotiana sylvestris TaxID=4096 RepID=UPI00388C5E83
MSWVFDAEIHLDAMGLVDTIKDKNQASNQDRAKAMIFLCHHFDEGLKMEYLIAKDPIILWNNLKVNETNIHQAKYGRGPGPSRGHGRGRGRNSNHVNKDLFRPPEEDEELLGPEIPYLSAIGTLMYLVNATRPDIAFSVNLLARYSSSPTWRHWNGIKHILRRSVQVTLQQIYSLNLCQLQLLRRWKLLAKVFIGYLCIFRKCTLHKYYGLNHHEEEEVMAYVDTLLNLELPEKKRKVNHGEIVSLCSEFLTAGTDTTSTSLQWIMANLVKYPSIQEKLYQEISEVVGSVVDQGVVKEEDLEKMPYIKAVILEGLRRHPPGHFLQPHMVTQEVELNGYVIPKDATINFMIAEMGWDPHVWEDPLDFKPDRFLFGDGGDTEEFDITGSREIKMIPFSAGRRICPAYGLAMLHLEYFVANLIWHFEWTTADGDNVDLSEKLEFTVTMKNPLRARIRPRINQLE